MQRAVFDRSVIDGYRTTKTETLAVSLSGRRLFIGTSDGSVVMYDGKLDSTRFTCVASETIRKPKDKKPVMGLLAVESWRTLLGIVDGTLSAFDMQFPQNVTMIADQKGCHCFAVNEHNRSIVIANKKKLFQYAWQAPGFAFVRDFNLTDIPKNLLFVRNAVIIGFRRHYECLDLVSGHNSRILDVEREHRMLVTEMSANTFRPDALLLSLGLQGVVLEMDKVLAGISFAYGSTSEERLEWGGVPVFCSVMLPFIVTGLADGVEIHDLGSLAPLQRISIATLSNFDLSFCSASVDLSSGEQRLGFICNGEELSLLKMIPIAKQVEELSTRGLHEDAINLYSMCAAPDTGAPDYVKGVDVLRLHETCANALLQKGDFDKAVKHYIDGNAEFVSVVRHFPDLVPQSMHTLLGIMGKESGSAGAIAGAVLHRAAAAVVHFCDYHRAKVVRRAMRAESLKELGILDSGMASLNSTNSAALYYGNGLGKSISTGVGTAQMTGAGSLGKDEDDDDYISDPDEEIRRAQLLDSVLLFALVNCQPPRRNAVVQLLSSGTNYCQVETSSVLLASQGNPFTEALLWLYRSHGLHSRVLDALKEEKSVAVGGWNRDQFYQWSADYLRWLWYHESDTTLPKLALFALKPLLEFDAELGLSVLLCRPSLSTAASASLGSLSGSKTSFGGKGLTISEVLSFLRTVNPRSAVRKSVPFGTSPAITSTVSTAVGNSNAQSKYALLSGSTALQAVVASMPLISGQALGVAFLECIVTSGDAPSSMHDEFAQLLIDGISESWEGEYDRDGDSQQLQQSEVYRKKLQSFLLASSEFHPQRVLTSLVPPYHFIKETALVLSRLGEHQAVLCVYVHILHDLRLAEWYCDRVYTAFQVCSGFNSNQSASIGDSNKASFSSTGGTTGVAVASANYAGMNVLVHSDEGVVSGLREAGDIYLTMFKVLLMEPDEVEEEVARHSLDQRIPLTRQECTEGAGGGGAVAVRTTWSVEDVVELAEKYFDRVNAAQLLELLPAHTPVACLLRFFKIVLEYGSAQKRNLQIIHQLLRVREVQIRTNN